MEQSTVLLVIDLETREVRSIESDAELLDICETHGEVFAVSRWDRFLFYLFVFQKGIGFVHISYMCR